jgi:hypothetical protein
MTKKQRFGDLGKVIYELEKLTTYQEDSPSFRRDAPGHEFTFHTLSLAQLPQLGRQNVQGIESTLEGEIDYLILAYFEQAPKNKRIKKAILKAKHILNEVEKTYHPYDLDPNKPVIPLITGKWREYFESRGAGSIVYVFSPAFSDQKLFSDKKLVELVEKVHLFAKARVQSVNDLPSLCFTPLEPFFGGGHKTGYCDPQSLIVVPEHVIDYLAIHKDYRKLWLSFVNPLWKHAKKYIQGINEITASKVPEN